VGGGNEEVGGWDERELRKWLCCVIYGVMRRASGLVVI